MRKRISKRVLARTIKPKGDSGVLSETLEDVVKFVRSIKPRPYGDRCAGEILKAATSGKRADIRRRLVGGAGAPA
jgi:hypothetical protein